jgi:phosphoglycerate dehydrogenase-like enzyme
VTRRVRALLLPHPAGPHMFDPWGADVVAALERDHDVAIFDAAAPAGPQLAGVEVVLDPGGAAGTHALADAAVDAVLWQILGTGYDHFDVRYWRQKGIAVSHCPGTQSAVALAECAILLILLLARRYPAASANVRGGAFYTPVGDELAGLRLCVVGFGASGRALAERARAFGMSICAIDAVPIDAAAHGLAAAGLTGDLDAQLADADVVSLHLPLDAGTRHLIDARRLALMRPTAWLINVSRGELVDEPALIDALRAGRLGGAGLDVFAEEPLPASSPLLATAHRRRHLRHLAAPRADRGHERGPRRSRPGSPAPDR